MWIAIMVSHETRVFTSEDSVELVEMVKHEREKLAKSYPNAKVLIKLYKAVEVKGLW